MFYIKEDLSVCKFVCLSELGHRRLCMLDPAMAIPGGRLLASICCISEAVR